jgi:hypothetical protein
MSAEAAIYPTPNSMSNRFLQNHPTFSFQTSPEGQNRKSWQLLEKRANLVNQLYYFEENFETTTN